MSLHSFLHRGDAPTAPKRITIRRRLLGRGSRLRSMSMAAGLLSLGLASFQPAHAGTITWDGVPADWFTAPSHWSNGATPLATDDAQNLTTAAMTLGQSTTVNSFLSNGAFTFNGGTFTGNQANAASTLQVNNIFTLNGGQINNFTLQAGVKQASGPVPSVVVTNSGGNGLLNTIVNANLDLATNANAFLRIQGTNTVNGTISFGTTSNGLNIYTTNDNLIIGGSGKLIGFGNVFESGSGSILTNNGLINANVSGKALTQTNSNFVNSGTAEATNGATLALNNTLTNSGKLIADGVGSTLTLAGTLASNAGNTISATNGGQVLVNGVALSGTLNGVGATSLILNNSGNNGLTNTTANINLDLATNANAFLRFQGIDTVNGAISLGTTSNGLNIYTTNDNLILSSTGSLTGFGNVFESGSGSILTNNGTINANANGKALTQTNTNFVNNGLAEATNGATLALNNNITNNGALAATGGSTLTLTGTLASNAGNTINGVGGTVNINGVALSGTLNGVGATSLIFNNSGNNGFNNTTANINLDLATNANAFLRIQGTNTVNGTISFGTTSNGLNIYTTGDNLIIGGGSKLIGFGNVFESGSGSILTNNGTINATGGALTQTNSNFVNNGTAKATNGATLALNNNIANSAGATVAATGAGSLVTLTGTFTGTGNNLITASGGGQVQVNGVALRGIINTDAGTSLILNNSGSNNLTNTVVNGNLSLTNNSFLRVQGTDTVNGTISLSTTSNGLDIYTTNDNLILGGSGKLVGFGTVFESGSGSILTNNGLVNANVSGKTLNIANSNFNNAGTTQVTNGATLSVTSNSTNSGVVNVQGGGTANFSGLTQTAGLTQVDGVLNLVNNSALTLSGTKSGGTLLGSGQIVGNVVNTNGIVSPGDSPGTLGITGNYTQGSAGTLDIEFTNSLHDLLNVSGLATTGGLLDVNYIDTSAFTGAVGSQFAFLDYGTLAAGSGPNFGFTVTGHNGFTYTVVNDAANKMLDLQIGAIGSPVPAVPEASTTLSFGLLLLLGLGGTVVATKRKKSD